jgi:predicted RNase H-like nuclease (RuvC/YqgF family)
MKARIAVVTISGRAYYIIVNELKRKNIPFLSLTPNESIPIGIKVVITTEDEKLFIKHERVLTYKPDVEPSVLANEALQIVRGKETYEKVVIGVDPGEVFGLAVLVSGRVIETDNCYSVKDVASRIESIVRGLENTPVALISVKIGNGVPEYKDKLLRALDNSLPTIVKLESVREDGTNSCLNEAKHRRGVRDIVSAIQIAGRNGQTYHRRKTDESYG